MYDFMCVCSFVHADTEGSFLAQRARTIAEGSVASMQRMIEETKNRHAAMGRPVPTLTHPSVDDLLQGIHVYRAFDHIDQLAIIKSLPSFLSKNPKVHLLIIDSVAFHFRRGFTDMALRSRMLTGMAQELLQLANQFKLAVRKDKIQQQAG